MINDLKYSVTAKDLDESFGRVATAASDTGTSFARFTAIVNAANEFSRQGVSVAEALRNTQDVLASARSSN